MFLFQDNVLNVINQIMDVCIPQDRAPRDFCVKFPEEIRHDNLAGQLWFGAEVADSCLGLGRGLGAIQPLLSDLTCVPLHIQRLSVSPPRAPPPTGCGWHHSEPVRPYAPQTTLANIDT